jgi:endonuclease III
MYYRNAELEKQLIAAIKTLNSIELCDVFDEIYLKVSCSYRKFQDLLCIVTSVLETNMTEEEIEAQDLKLSQTPDSKVGRPRSLFELTEDEVYNLIYKHSENKEK